MHIHTLSLTSYQHVIILSELLAINLDVPVLARSQKECETVNDRCMR